MAILGFVNAYFFLYPYLFEALVQPLSRDDCCMIIKQFFWIIFYQTNTHNRHCVQKLVFFHVIIKQNKAMYLEGLIHRGQKIWTSSSISIHNSGTLIGHMSMWLRTFKNQLHCTYWLLPELFLYVLMNLATNSAE
jgi:hypothetical protein